MVFKKVLTTLLIIMSIFISFPICADTNKYTVKDNESGLIEEFSDYDEAYEYYEDNKDKYNNLILITDDKVIEMEYGIVRFDDNVDYFDYYSVLKNGEDILCSSYGIDGAYLYTLDNDVYFKVAGDIGYTNIDNVTLIPYEELNVRISLYHTDDTYLYHNIKNQLDFDYYAYSLKIDFIPEYLDANTDYYSYDGHYFYDDFYLMINDYNNGSYDNAINEMAYYNYYQYLPYRSLTNYTYLELEYYFYNTLGIDSNLVRYTDLNGDGASDEINRSQFYGNIDEFFTSQNIYGANALMLISEAINESNYGRSKNAYFTNNLYSTSAFNTSIERNTKRYNNVAKSIQNYAKYFVSNRYSNYLRDDYCGCFLGDKYVGITSAYKLDHYAGERAASVYFNIDDALGLKDYNTYSLGLASGEIDLYNDGELKDYKTSIDIEQLSCIVLDETDESYLIQLDNSFNKDYYYDFEDSIAYVDKDEITLIIDNGSNDDEFVKITYDFAGGTYDNKQSITINTKKGSLPVYIEPKLDGYFACYDKEFTLAEQETTYTAVYRQIDNIVVYNLFEKQSSIYPSLDISDAYINVKYTDGLKEKVFLTSDMLSYIDIDEFDDQEITITYCGVSTSQIIKIDEDIAYLYEEIDEAIDNEDYEFVKENLDDVSYSLSMSKIRQIDNVLDTNRNYVINDKTGKLDISVSGLNLSFADNNNFSLFKDTYYVEIDNIKPSNRERIENIAKGYGFNSILGIDISFKFNFQNIDLNGPAIVQLGIDNKDNDDIYTVYHADDNGDIVKCYTSQTNNYVQFIIYESGDYLILSKDGYNIYDIEDSIENLNKNNVGFDYHKFNLNVLCITVLDLVCIIGIIVYYIFSKKKVNQWKDFKKSLQKAAIVQEEKLKN